MQKGRAKLIATVGLIGLLGSAQGIQAGTYLGEYCWDIEFSVPGGLTALQRTAVTDMGDGHFFLNGKAISNTGAVVAIHGNAELDGSQIYFAGVGGGSKSMNTWNQTIFWLLDASTLNGTMTQLHTQYDKASKTFTNSYREGTITYTSCPEKGD